jgi:shikimate kinase
MTAPGGRVFLTGFMAAGKSEVGRKLADRLGWGFVDLDEQIEARTARTIPDLFEEGEETFRTREREALEEVAMSESRVIALGGGALGWKDSLQYIRARGPLVYLRVDSATLFDRLSHSDADRPMLDGKSGDDLRRHIDDLLAARQHYYEAATLTVDAGDGRTIDEIVEELLDALSSRLPADTG